MRRSISRWPALSGVGVRACLLAMALPRAVLGQGPVPRPEHPRPDAHRDTWLNLNGTWQFALRDKPTDDPEAVTFDRKIVVPFPWQSRLSGVAAIRDGVGWYQRDITVPAQWKGQRVFLRFGAVDQEATVWLDGKRIGENKVAYIPFAFDVTEQIKWGRAQKLTVRAVDLGSTSYPKGKQQGWYTPSGGIWQTVWLEARPATYVDCFRILPDIKNGSATFEIDVCSRDGAGSATVSVGSESGQFPAVTAKANLTNGRGSARLTVRVPDPKLWHPDTPHLYPAVVEVKAGATTDAVRTYFGLREVTRAKWQDRPYEYILLNGEPIYLRTALDQSFNPEGVYTAPSDEFLRRDMEITKQAGMNGLRIHIKVDEPRRLYWADKLGVLILADIPNLGSKPPTNGKRCNWEDTWRGAIRRDFNHPCIIAWVLFNETWGIRHDATWDAWIEELYHRTRKLDPTRLCEDNSPCRYDHVITDINSWHFYINSYPRARLHIQNVVKNTRPGSGFNYVKGRKQGIEPLINSEYGGISAGGGDGDISWCIKYLTNELRLYPKICGYVYTELSDIEWEHNGVVNYDRSGKAYGYDAFCSGMTVADVFAADFVCMDIEPCPRRKPGEPLEVPLRFSHFGRQRIESARLTWQLDGVDRFGRPVQGLASGRYKFVPKQYDVMELPAIKAKLPSEQMVAALWCCVTASDGRVVARNYVNVDVIGEPQPRVEAPDPHTLAIRWDPLLEEVPCPPPVSPADTPSLEKRWVEKDGAVRYRITWPDGIKPSDVDRIVVTAELAARAGKEKYDWPGPKGNHNYPQTQDRKFPSDVEVVLAGQKIARMTLPDDPADARGVLSHAKGFDPGSYGYLKSIAVGGQTLQAVLKAVTAATSGDQARPIELTFRVAGDARHRRGVAVFGDRLGRYPVDPTLTIHTRRPHEIKPGLGSAPMRWLRVVPTADEGKHMWRYTTERPADRWFDSAFDDASWKTGRSGFGKPGTPGSRVFTKWETPDIWLRKTFELPDEPVVGPVILKFHHDEDMVVYLNGHVIQKRSGHLSGYTTRMLPPDTARRLRKGKNVLAVHCRQTRGGQFIDVGLSVLVR